MNFVRKHLTVDWTHLSRTSEELSSQKKTVSTVCCRNE
uniref:Uncharacterized protein n=1 Tax=Anguilla anguilla TaxID=7936 RepID=A0A0E9PE75_ANGAN